MHKAIAQPSNNAYQLEATSLWNVTLAQMPTQQLAAELVEKMNSIGDFSASNPSHLVIANRIFNELVKV